MRVCETRACRARQLGAGREKRRRKDLLVCHPRGRRRQQAGYSVPGPGLLYTGMLTKKTSPYEPLPIALSTESLPAGKVRPGRRPTFVRCSAGPP